MENTSKTILIKIAGAVCVLVLFLAFSTNATAQETKQEKADRKDVTEAKQDLKEARKDVANEAINGNTDKAAKNYGEMRDEKKRLKAERKDVRANTKGTERGAENGEGKNRWQQIVSAQNRKPAVF